MTPSAENPRSSRDHRAGPVEDAGIAIVGRGRLVALFAWPMVGFAAVVALLGFLLVIGPGVEIGFRIAGLFLGGLGALVAWAEWALFLGRPRLNMHIYPEEIVLLRKGDVVAVIDRDDIGCVVRWDTKMCVFDHEDRLIGEWELGWAAGMRSEQLFKRAMRHYDYPSRLFFARPRPVGQASGPSGPREFVETGRTGAIERTLGPLAFGDKWVLPGGATIQPGPGLSGGPMADYVAALTGTARPRQKRKRQP